MNKTEDLIKTLNGYTPLNLNPNISNIELKGGKNKKYLQLTLKLDPTQFLKNESDVASFHGVLLGVIKEVEKPKKKNNQPL